MNRVFGSRTDNGDYYPDDQLPETLKPLFEHMRETYHKFLVVSRQALSEGEKWCEVDLGKGPVKMRSLKYSEISRSHIKKEIESLSSEQRVKVDTVLGSMGVLEAYLLPELSL